jgi:2-polyprenyl-6-methoxyphenol hydroxylase-like FAD-dependent oxidoreductase
MRRRKGHQWNLGDTSANKHHTISSLVEQTLTNRDSIMTTSKSTHAIVIGGSIAGLLTARVLSDFYGRVTIIERDELPLDASYRNGAPQAKHLHALLARGQQIMERMFPGLTDEMTHSSAPTMRMGLDNSFYTAAGWAQEFDTGVRVNGMARASLEWLVRQRVMAIANVSFVTETDVEQLIADATKQTVIGVETKSRRTRQTETLLADLVVDASGRRSHAPEWLETLGYAAPETSIVDSHCGYATRWYELPADAVPEKKLAAIQVVANGNLYRGGGYLMTESTKMVVTLIGANGDYPPTEEDEFMAFMRSLPVSAVYDVVQRATPITPVLAYRGLHNQIRHYEKIARRPENFLVIGDAAIAFNPIYGQGMSSAAMEAEKLGDLLRQHGTDDLRDFAGKFQRAIIKLTHGAWQLSTSEDMRFPLVEGKTPGMFERVMHKYTDWTLRAAGQDKVIGKAFIEVMNLLKTPTSLLRPDIVARVFWQLFRQQTRKNKTAATAAHTAYQPQ